MAVLGQKEALIDQLRSKSENEDALRNQIKDLQNKLAMRKTNSADEMRLNQQEQIEGDKKVLSSLNLDQDLALNPRDFSDLKKLAPEQTVKAYSDAVKFIADLIQSKNQQSKQFQANFKLFNQNLGVHNFVDARTYLDRMAVAPSTRTEERQYLSFAGKLLSKISEYLK